MYQYKPQNDDELELTEGDTVYVMEKCDDGWFVGTSLATGLFGTFPGNYVERAPWNPKFFKGLPYFKKGAILKQVLKK